MSGRAHILRLCGLVVLVVVCAACKVDARVSVIAERSGSGTVNVRVVLDRAAADRLGDPATALRLDDVRAAGWDLDAPDVTRSGLVLNATKRFQSPDDLQSVLDEAGGKNGVFRGWVLKVDDGFSSTDYRLGGAVHLTGKLDQFSDAEIAKALDGLPLGRTDDELAKALGPRRDAVSLSVRAALPGSGEAQEDFTIGDGSARNRTMLAHSTVSDGAPARWLILAIAALAAAGALVMVPRLRRS